MSDTTKIQWATATFNPWIGCTKVSAGCKNCYAENVTRARVLRSQGHETWGKGAKRSRTSAATWKQPLKWNREAGSSNAEWVAAHMSDLLPGMPPRPRIFPSLCDWLDDEVPIEWLADFLKLIHDTPNLDWLLLTKRPENWANRLSMACHEGGPVVRDFVKAWRWGAGLFPPNVWIGTSCEDQPNADKRIPELLKIPAKVRFLSLEPLLGPINLTGNKEGEVWPWCEAIAKGEGINWVIVGGESGSHSRPCHVQWIRSIVAQCKLAGTACFVKQLGAEPAGLTSLDLSLIEDKKGGDIEQWPDDLKVRQFPKLP